MANEVKLKPCPFCGNDVDENITNYGITSFLVDTDGVILGEIICPVCSASVSCMGGDDVRARAASNGSMRIHPADLLFAAEATIDKWNRRACDE